MYLSLIFVFSQYLQTSSERFSSEFLGNVVLIEDEFTSLLLVHVSQVKGNAHNIALSCVITFFFIVINDVAVTVLLAC